MADATSSGSITLELHGFLADRLGALGRRRGTRTLIAASIQPSDTVSSLLARLVENESAYALLFQHSDATLPEHVEVVLNDRLLDLQGGLDAPLNSGDVLSFLPAHAGGN